MLQTHSPRLCHSELQERNKDAFRDQARAPDAHNTCRRPPPPMRAKMGGSFWRRPPPRFATPAGSSCRCIPFHEQLLPGCVATTYPARATRGALLTYAAARRVQVSYTRHTISPTGRTLFLDPGALWRSYITPLSARCRLGSLRRMSWADMKGWKRCHESQLTDGSRSDTQRQDFVTL